MRTFSYLLLIIFLTSCDTNKVEQALTHIDLWTNTEDYNVHSGNLKIRTITNISFRNNVIEVISLSENDTIFRSKDRFNWECEYPNIVRYSLNENTHYSEFVVEEYSSFNLKIIGLRSNVKASLFQPKLF